MKRNTALTKYDLFRAAMREPLRETLALIPFFFAGLFVWETVVMHDRNTGRLLLFSACSAVSLWVFIALIFCSLAFDGLLLLHRQEKSLGFTFEDEGLTEIETNDKWYLSSEGARVLAIRRGFIRKVWKPHRVGNFLWKLRIEDINGKRHRVKGHISDLEGLINWLNDDKGKTEQ